MKKMEAARAAAAEQTSAHCPETDYPQPEVHDNDAVEQEEPCLNALSGQVEAVPDWAEALSKYHKSDKVPLYLMFPVTLRSIPSISCLDSTGPVLQTSRPARQVSRISSDRLD